MKKLFILFTAAVLALCFVGCGGQTGSTSQPETESQSTPVVTTYYFGKISAVAGNEIEMNLAKEPEMPDQPQTEQKDEDGMMAAVTMTPSMEAGTGEGGGAANRVEVEYTGEIKTFIIPAGLPIKDAMGNEKQLSDIKNGSIMNILVDENENITEVFLYE